MTRAEVQRIQRRVGAEPDGWWGPLSMEACQRHLRSLLPNPSPFPKPDMASMTSFYGLPGEVPLVRVKPPYRMFLYDGPDVISGIAIHPKCAESLQSALEDLVDLYPTAEKRREAGIDKFFGSFVNRPQRGGTRPSKHAWAAAVDFDANRNGLHTPWPTKSAMPLEVFEVFARRGWINLGWVIWRDGMHVQATS